MTHPDQKGSGFKQVNAPMVGEMLELDCGTL